MLDSIYSIYFIAAIGFAAAFLADYATSNLIIEFGKPLSCIGISLLRSFPIPLFRFCIALLYPKSVLIQNTEYVLCICISLFSRKTIPFGCLVVILIYTVTAVSYFAHGLGIAIVGSGTQLTYIVFFAVIAL